MFLKKEKDCLTALCSSGNKNDYYDPHSGYLFVSFKTASNCIKSLETLMRDYKWCIVGISNVNEDGGEFKYNKRAKSLQDYLKMIGFTVYLKWTMKRLLIITGVM